MSPAFTASGCIVARPLPVAGNTRSNCNHRTPRRGVTSSLLIQKWIRNGNQLPILLLILLILLSLTLLILLILVLLTLLVLLILLLLLLTLLILLILVLLTLLT